MSTQLVTRTCSVEGCEKPRGGAYRMCFMHQGHMRRYGFTTTPQRGGVPKGTHLPGRPLSDRPSYSAVHLRAATRNGKASSYTCICCDRAADDWALLPGDPNLLTDDRGRTYSTNLGFYVPMATPCHIRFDRGGE